MEPKSTGAVHVASSAAIQRAHDS